MRRWRYLLFTIGSCSCILNTAWTSSKCSRMPSPDLARDCPTILANLIVCFFRKLIAIQCADWWSYGLTEMSYLHCSLRSSWTLWRQAARGAIPLCSSIASRCLTTFSQWSRPILPRHGRIGWTIHFSPTSRWSEGHPMSKWHTISSWCSALPGWVIFSAQMCRLLPPLLLKVHCPNHK